MVLLLLLTALVSKDFSTCNGVLGMSGGATTASTETADEVQVVISDPELLEQVV